MKCRRVWEVVASFADAVIAAALKSLVGDWYTLYNEAGFVNEISSRELESMDLLKIISR